MNYNSKMQDGSGRHPFSSIRNAIDFAYHYFPGGLDLTIMIKSNVTESAFGAPDTLFKSGSNHIKSISIR
jgi:hypothetical protein